MIFVDIFEEDFSMDTNTIREKIHNNARIFHKKTLL